MDLLQYLENNISDNNTIDEIINIFEEMCKTPIEEDLLLNEYGVYDFTGEDLFYYDLVRQYPDGEDEYYQLRVSIMFSPDEENRDLHDTLWNDYTNEIFFDFIRKSDGYEYAKNHNLFVSHSSNNQKKGHPKGCPFCIFSKILRLLGFCDIIHRRCCK